MRATINEYKEVTSRINFSKFTPVGGDIDHRAAERTINGRITRKRLEIINRFARKNSFSTHCGHEYDCCGCMHSQSLDVTLTHTSAKLTLTQSFNY